MRGAWYVVEVYCFLNILHALGNVKKCIDDPVLLVPLFGELGLVLLLSWLTFCGKRLASRMLAAHIALNVVLYVWIHEIQQQGFDIYRAYHLIIQTYLLGGAIKLWRIKELPTRFTDPPAEPPAHA